MQTPSAQLVKFQDMDLEMFTVNGRKCFTAETIGKALQYKQPRVQIMRLFNRNRDEFEEEIDFGVVKLTTPGGIQDVTIFYQTGVNLLGMFSEQPLAKAFRRWAKHVLAAVQELQQAEPQAELSCEQFISLQNKYIQLLEEKVQFLQTPWVGRKPKTRRITDEEKKQILELYKLGYSHRDIGAAIGRSNTAVGYVIREAKQAGEV